MSWSRQRLCEDGTMTSLPPRRKSVQSMSSWSDKSALEILQLMGFPKARVEKAIAATGSKGVQLASEWLLSHVNDPCLDQVVPREYIIYLCPKGELLDQLLQFWEDSLRQIGWNSAHIYHPHITLCSFFPMADSQVDILDPVMELLLQELSQWPRVGPIKLDLYTKNKNFIGYFVKSPHDSYVESLMVRLQQEFLKAGVEMKPQLKQLHLTLAFQYNPEHHDMLMGMAHSIDLSTNGFWEIQVYSRDPVVKAAEVRRVLKHYKPTQADELELNVEDFVYMDPEEHTNSPDGWFKGTSWRTGLTAFFPGNFTSKCAQMEIWTLHRYATLPNFSKPQNDGGKSPAAIIEAMEIDSGDYDNVWHATGPEGALYAKVNKGRKKSPEPPRPPRKLLIVRHGERCDFAFSRSWFDKSFDREGRYTRFNLNSPKQVVQRANFEHFSKDCPLTMIGQQQALITGEALLDAGQTITSVYCSPALRCVQTATEILKGMRSPCRLRVEPALFEWCGWYKPHMPTFLSPMEMEANGFPVDSSYVPFQMMAGINMAETVGDYYNRSYNFTKDALKKHKDNGGLLLFVGHAGSLDACTRLVLGHPAREAGQFMECVRGCPYCSMCCMEEHSVEAATATGGWRLKERSGDDGGPWRLVEPPILPLTHGANKDGSWRKFLS